MEAWFAKSMGSLCRLLPIGPLLFSFGIATSSGAQQIDDADYVRGCFGDTDNTPVPGILSCDEQISSQWPAGDTVVWGTYSSERRGTAEIYVGEPSIPGYVQADVAAALAPKIAGDPYTLLVVAQAESSMSWAPTNQECFEPEPPPRPQLCTSGPVELITGSSLASMAASARVIQKQAPPVPISELPVTIRVVGELRITGGGSAFARVVGGGTPLEWEIFSGSLSIEETFDGEVFEIGLGYPFTKQVGCVAISSATVESASCSAVFDPVFEFDQATLDAALGASTFPIDEFFELGFNSNVPAFGPLVACGDLDENGLVEPVDVSIYRSHLSRPLVEPLSPGALDRCEVVPASGCDVRDVAVIRRTLEQPSLAPGISPVCDALAGPTLIVEPGPPSRAWIDAAGGVLEATAIDGTRYILTIPPGGIIEPEGVHLSMNPTGPLAQGLPAGISSLHGVRLEPDGQQFVNAATLRIELPSAQPQNELLAYGFRGLGSDPHFVPLITDVVDVMELELPVGHFSGVGCALGAPIDLQGADIPNNPPEALLLHDMSALVHVVYANSGGQLDLDTLDHLREPLGTWFDQFVSDPVTSGPLAAVQNCAQLPAAAYNYGNWAAHVIDVFGSTPQEQPSGGAQDKDLGSRYQRAVDAASQIAPRLEGDLQALHSVCENDPDACVRESAAADVARCSVAAAAFFQASGIDLDLSNPAALCPGVPATVRLFPPGAPGQTSVRELAMCPGDIVTLESQVLDAGANELFEAVTWETDNGLVATAEDLGSQVLLTALSPGEASVVAATECQLFSDLQVRIGPPNLLGLWDANGLATRAGCQDGDDDGPTIPSFGEVNINDQVDNPDGSGEITVEFEGGNASGVLNCDGTFTLSGTYDDGDSSGILEVTNGQVTGSTGIGPGDGMALQLTITYTATDLFGDSCVETGTDIVLDRVEF